MGRAWETKTVRGCGRERRLGRPGISGLGDRMDDGARGLMGNSRGRAMTGSLEHHRGTVLVGLGRAGW